MLTTQNYPELVELLEYPDGRTVILANEWDIASQRASVAELASQLEDLQEEELAPKLRQYTEVIRAFERGETLEGEQAPPNEAEYKRAAARVNEWEDIKIADWRNLQLGLKGAKRFLARLEALPSREEAAQRGARLRPLSYAMRTFTHAERVQVDDNHTAINPERGTRYIDDVPARNIALLKLILQSETDGEETRQISDPATQLRDGLCQVLIKRMWVRNTMQDDLRGYFRQRGEDPRESEA